MQSFCAFAFALPFVFRSRVKQMTSRNDVRKSNAREVDSSEIEGTSRAANRAANESEEECGGEKENNKKVFTHFLAAVAVDSPPRRSALDESDPLVAKAQPDAMIRDFVCSYALKTPLAHPFLESENSLFARETDRLADC